MASQGPFFPTSVTTDGSGDEAWSNPTNAEATDSSYATSTLLPSETTDNLWSTGYGFSIPTLSGAGFVDGIQVVVITKFDGNSSAEDATVQLVLEGFSASSNKATGSTYSDGVTNTITYGGPSDTWGSNLRYFDANGSSFGASYSATNTDGSTDVTANVDSISITIYYTPPEQFVTLGAITSTTVGSPHVSASAAITLGAITSTHVGNPTVSPGTVSATLQGIHSTVVGSPGVASTAAITLGGIHSTVVGNPICPALQATVQGIHSTLVGSPGVSPGPASVTLGGIRESVIGSPGVSPGVASVTLGGIHSTAVGSPTSTPGVATTSLAAITSTRVGAPIVLSDDMVILASITSTIVGSPGVARITTYQIPITIPANTVAEDLYSILILVRVPLDPDHYTGVSARRNQPCAA